MAITKCFLNCGSTGTYPLTACSDGTKHRICNECIRVLNEEQNISTGFNLDSYAAHLIREHKRAIVIEINNNDYEKPGRTCEKTPYSMELTFDLVDMESKVQWFIANSFDQHFKRNGYTEVTMVVSKHCGYDASSEVLYTLDYQEECKKYSYAGETACKQWFKDTSGMASYMYQKARIHRSVYYGDARQWFDNKAHLPYISFFYTRHYLATFERAYDLCLDLLRKGKDPMNFSIAELPNELKTVRGIELAEKAQPGYEVVYYYDGRVYRVATFVSSIKQGVVVRYEGKEYTIKHHWIVSIEPKKPTHQQIIARAKEAAKNAQPGYIVTYWYGGMQEKDVFIDATDKHVTVGLKTGEEYHVMYLNVISIEPLSTPDKPDQAENTPAITKDQAQAYYASLPTPDDNTCFGPIEEDDEIDLSLPVPLGTPVDTSFTTWLERAKDETVDCAFCGISGPKLSMDIMKNSYGGNKPYCSKCVALYCYAGIFRYPEHVPAFTVALWHDGLWLQDIDALNEIEAHKIARAKLGATVQVPDSIAMFTTVNLANVYDINGLIIGSYTPDKTLFNLSSSDQDMQPACNAWQVPASTQDDNTMEHNPVTLPSSSLLPSDDLDEDIEHLHQLGKDKPFKSQKANKLVQKIRKNALNHTSRFLAILVLAILACSIGAMLHTPTSHAQTNTSNAVCKVHKYAHRPGYYSRGYGKTTFYATPPKNCIVYNGATDNNNGPVVSTSTPASTQASANTSTTHKHSKKHHSAKKHHTSTTNNTSSSSSNNTPASTQASSTGCKYTFDDSDTGTHKRECQGVSITIKIDD